MSIDISQTEHVERGNAVALFESKRFLEMTLDLLPVGIVLVGGKQHIVQSNAIARAMLRCGEPIMSHCGQLRADCPRRTAALGAAIRDVFANRSACSAGIGVPLFYGDGRAAIAHVLLLSSRYIAGMSGRAAAIFITGTADYTALPLDALTTLFKLTSSEGRVLQQSVLGRNRRQTAAALGVTESTVKTHLIHIYAKTGTSNQISLCQLVSRLSWPFDLQRSDHRCAPAL